MSMKAQCKKCQTVIQSKSRHNFVSCACGAIFVDGGDDYFRCGYDIPENILFLYEDGRVESGLDSIRKYNEEHPSMELSHEISLDAEDQAPLTTTERTNILLEEVLAELREVKRLSLAIGAYLSK